jgi:hypothetical protein
MLRLALLVEELVPIGIVYPFLYIERLNDDVVGLGRARIAVRHSPKKKSIAIEVTLTEVYRP